MNPHSRRSRRRLSARPRRIYDLSTNPYAHLEDLPPPSEAHIRFLEEASADHIRTHAAMRAHAKHIGWTHPGLERDYARAVADGHQAGWDAHEQAWLRAYQSIED